ncbi:MAG: CPBP family intramembrane metalloprotease [Chloroflexaceae bacterium]|nr:CPBP family intramembrane metalloprotease [Chloroflexaceae bacterium]
METLWLSTGKEWLKWLLAANSLVKIGIFLVVWAGLWLPVALHLKRGQWRSGLPLTPQTKLPLLATLYAIAPIAIWGAAHLEGRSWAEWGLPGQPQLLLQTALGWVLAVGSTLVVLALEGYGGWVQWQRENLPRLWPLLLPVLALALAIGLVEELVFRGFMLGELQQDYGFWQAAAIASLLFALLHLVWEQRETLPQLPGLWVMGMVLSEAYRAGGNLGLAWGLHAGWIWALTVFKEAGVLVYTGRGPAWLVGWRELPLAGAVGLLLLLATGWGLRRFEQGF